MKKQLLMLAAIFIRQKRFALFGTLDLLSNFAHSIE